MEPRDVIRAIAGPTGDIGASFYFVPETVARAKELGLDGLAKGSNFEVLEALFVNALVHHVKELRFGMLHGQVRTLLERLARVLQKTSDDARTAAGILDRAIEGLLAVVGYPGVGTEARNALKAEGRREDLLSWVERVRGGPYDTKAQGKLARFARQRLEAEIGALRARSLSAAEEVVRPSQRISGSGTVIELTSSCV